MTWAQSQTRCATIYGGQLATIRSAAEQNTTVFLIMDETTAMSTKNTWIGLKDDIVEGSWYSTETNETLAPGDYTNWCGVPTNSAGIEDCAIIRPSAICPYGWYANDCAQSFPFGLCRVLVYV
jgi:hypothetical protein